MDSAARGGAAARQTASLDLATVVAALEEAYPAATAQSWDQVGLVTGDLAQPVRHVHFAVDPTMGVIEEARELGADLLVTHHPLLLRGVHSVATTTAKGACVTSLVVADIALFVAHTNADVAQPGVCDALADACGLAELTPLSLEEGRPMGRVGRLPESISLRDLAARLAAALPAAPVGIRVAGDRHAAVSSVAVLGGAGDGLFEAVRDRGVDVYVTADLRHHPALEAREEARHGRPYLIDAGHWATEWLWLPGAADRLVAALGPAGAQLRTSVSTLVTDPWDFVVGAAGPDGWGPDSAAVEQGGSRE